MTSANAGRVLVAPMQRRSGLNSANAVSVAMIFVDEWLPLVFLQYRLHIDMMVLVHSLHPVGSCANYLCNL